MPFDRNRTSWNHHDEGREEQDEMVRDILLSMKSVLTKPRASSKFYDGRRRVLPEVKW